jgi:hypothetical protein
MDDTGFGRTTPRTDQPFLSERSPPLATHHMHGVAAPLEISEARILEARRGHRRSSELGVPGDFFAAAAGEEAALFDLAARQDLDDDGPAAVVQLHDVALVVVAGIDAERPTGEDRRRRHGAALGVTNSGGGRRCVVRAFDVALVPVDGTPMDHQRVAAGAEVACVHRGVFAAVDRRRRAVAAAGDGGRHVAGRRRAVGAKGWTRLGHTLPSDSACCRWTTVSLVWALQIR